MRALALLLALALPTGSAAQSLGLDPLSDRFAACAGRLAGLMEHQWLADDPASVATEARVATMRELVEATLAPGKAAAALARETEAKFAWERLMKRADEEDGGWALARAEAEIATCTQLLLP
jgi:hypothetical protein